MNSIRKILFFCLVVLLCGLLGGSAAHAEGSGLGEVSLDSKITFYQGDKGVSKPSVPPKTLAKPTLLPKTGEIIRKYSVIGVALLVVMGWLVFFKRKKQGRQI